MNRMIMNWRGSMIEIIQYNTNQSYKYSWINFTWY